MLARYVELGRHWYAGRGDALEDAVFEVITPSLAELSIPARPNDFGVRSSVDRVTTWAPVHDIGVYGAPRWRIRQPMVPDDGWELETLPSGRLLSERRPVPEQFEWAYLTWAEHSRAQSGAAVLHALPPGRYLVVRPGVEPRREQRVLLGNESVPSLENMLVLYDKRPFYGLVIGAESDRPPVTTHPLVGLVALSYVGGRSVQAALFFDCLAREGSRPLPGATNDLVLVLPVTGELVIDGSAQYQDGSTEDQDRWRDTGALQLARALMRGP